MKNKELVIFIPSIEGGGVEKNLFIISNFLSNKLDKVSIITASPEFNNRFNSKINYISLKKKIYSKCGRTVKYFISLFFLFLKILSNKNIIVLSFQANLYCIVLCKILGIKIIVRSNSSPIGWLNNSLKKVLFKRIYKLADSVIVNSKNLKSEFNNLLKLTNVICIYNPLNITAIKKLSKIKKIKKINKNKNVLSIITVGRLVFQKNHIELLRAANIIKNKLNFHITIIGRGDKKDELQNYIKNNGLKRFIKIINYTKNPFPYIKNSELFILSSIYEGLPNVLLEAIVLNKFVISSNCPTGPSEILSNGKGGLLYQPNNETDLANKIIFYSKNKQFCQKKIDFAKKNLNKFNYDKNLKKYLKKIKEFL